MPNLWRILVGLALGTLAVALLRRRADQSPHAGDVTTPDETLPGPITVSPIPLQ